MPQTQSFDLPINACLPELLATLVSHDEVVLQAPPGAGKTTQVPLALLGQPSLEGQKIIVLEPRRVAAINAANRMAHTLNEAVGETVGYRMRGATKVGAKTRIEVITEGLLTRWLQDDPELTGVGAVIFDEFHERSINTDTGLALCLQAREVFRETPLKIIIMSATLDGEGVASLLGGAPMVTSEGRCFPITTHYNNKPIKTADIVTETVRTVLQAHNQEQGSCLVFLPGVREISQVQEQLRAHLPNTTHCQPLHGNLPLSQQQAAIKPAARGERKIVLATDIAETSLTIEDVRIVVDAGLTRNPVFDPNTAITRLHTQAISQANAEQRAGRAGRTQPGVCYRLWTQSQQQQKPQHLPPEILNADLTPLALTLLSWGANDPSELAWLNTPPTAHWQQAIDTLQKLNVAENSELNDDGERLASLPCHPRAGKLLLSAEQHGVAYTGALLAAILSEKIPPHSPADLSELLLRFASHDKGTHEKGLQGQANRNRGWESRIKQLAQQFTKLLSRQPTKVDDLHVGLLLAGAYPDRIAKKRQERNGFTTYQLTNGRSAQISTTDSLAKHEWLVVAEAGGLAGKSEDRIFCAAPLDNRLFDTDLSSLLQARTVAQWNHDKNRFIAERQQRIGKIVYRTEILKDFPKALKQEALTELIRNKGLKLLNWSESSTQLCARVNLLHKELGEPWPDFSQQALLDNLEQWLSPNLDDINTLNQLQALELFPLLKQQLEWPLPQELDQLAPERIAIPSGRNASIDYTQTPPVLAVKLQEMFGCEKTPSILNQRMQLMLHLLSPAKKPLQVTQDLTTFWANAYNEVKKEMKGRYPRHPWPDDPLSFEATALTKRKLNNLKS